LLRQTQVLYNRHGISVFQNSRKGRSVLRAAMSDTGNSQWYNRIGLIVGGVAAFGTLLAGLAPYISGRDQPAPQPMPSVERAAPAAGAGPAIAAPSSAADTVTATLVAPSAAPSQQAAVDLQDATMPPSVPAASSGATQAIPEKLDRRLTALENRPFSLCGLNGVTASLWKGPGGAPTGKVTIRMPASEPIIATLGTKNEVKAGCWLEVVDLKSGPPYQAVFRETSGPQ
jgi:hypothetical protein